MTMLSDLSCNNPPGAPAVHGPGTFGYDLGFLQRHDSVIVLQQGNARLIVSPKYQAKVFTSTNDGDGGASFGWIHYKAFDGPADPHMNAYGGENRLWLGPEGGKFALFFPPGAKMEFANWKTPAAFDTEPWQVTKQSDHSVSLHKDMQLTNYAGTRLSLSVNRTIELMAVRDILGNLPQAARDSVKVVGYKTINTLINTGTQPWTEKTGAPCIWLLDMFPPSEKTVIAIPYGHGGVVTSDYFGQIPADRLKTDSDVVLFRADGRQRGKLGIGSAHAGRVAGSYDPARHLLTLIRFDVDNESHYCNQEWNVTKPPFAGDAVNAYNDGPLADGSQMGPFYELESVGPAAMLAPGAQLVHYHSVYHFTGPESGLDAISRSLLGVPLEKMRTAF
jgi:hypothetical protein